MEENNQIFDYYEWLIFDKLKMPRNTDYNLVLKYLFDYEFVFDEGSKDENRAKNGYNLRSEYADEENCNLCLYLINTPCSILEMMVALSCFITTIMKKEGCDDYDLPAFWFSYMLENLGLNINDESFDKSYAKQVCRKFVDRKYSKNGKGGLFKFENSKRNVRVMDILSQLYLWLNVHFSDEF